MFNWEWPRRSLRPIIFGAFFISVAGNAAVPIQRISTDPYLNPGAQHATEVEPDTLSFGDTIVSSFQVGRFFEGGSTNIGFAASLDAGQSWINGFLPGITAVEGGPFDRASDTSVAFDSAHGVWLIASLALVNTPNVHGQAVVVNRSTDGGRTWSNPIVISSEGNSDKPWIVCDNFAISPFVGRCYVEWSEGGVLHFSTSTNGGVSWRNSFSVASIISHQVAGGLRAPVLPTTGGLFNQAIFTTVSGLSTAPFFSDYTRISEEPDAVSDESEIALP